MKKKYSMKIISIACAMCVTFVAESAPKCTLKTLKGTFIYSSSGRSDGKVYFEAGQEIFDGKGGIQNTYTNAQGQTIKAQGSYTMDGSCVGTAIYPDSGDSYAIFTGPKGDYFSWASTSPSNLVEGWEYRVSTSVNQKCSVKTLKGTYLYSQQGTSDGKRYVESGKDLFDGAGGVVNIYMRASADPIVIHGTYIMDENCIGKAIYADTGDSYAIYAGPKGDHLQVISENGQNPGFSVAPEYRVSRALIGLPAATP